MRNDWRFISLVVSMALLSISVACATSPPSTVAAGGDALAGCRLQVAAAVCDDGTVILDVGTAAGAPGERIVAVQGATDRVDDAFQLEAGAPQTTADGDVIRVDVVRPFRMPTVAVGSVMFLAPAVGQGIVSCASFGDPAQARCAERARAMLVAAVPDTATIQHRPSVTLRPDPTCTGTDNPLALQRLCEGDVKLSVVGIRGRFGPASSWWLWHRIVLAQATSVRLVTACPVLGAVGPCAVVDVGDKVGIFGLHVERDELRIAACFAPPGDAGIPRPCTAAFGEGPAAVAQRHINAFDVPTGEVCTFTQDNADTWSRRIDCEGDQATVAQFAGREEATAWIEARTTAPARTALCVVAGAPVACTIIEHDGATIWRADVDGPVVDTIVCAARSATLPALCRPFIDLMP